jgi:hypothetical protein
LCFVAAVRLLSMTLACTDKGPFYMEVVLRMRLACGIAVDKQELQFVYI